MAGKTLISAHARSPFPGRRRRLAAVALTGALLLAACSSDGDSGNTSATSPLAEFLGDDRIGISFDPDDPETQARFAEENLRREEAIAACMGEQGFEYIPEDTSDFNFAAGEDGIDFNSREYAEKWGFGITTQRFSQETVGPDLVGIDFSAFDEQAEAGPNQKIVEAMDEATQEAYYEALWGDEDDFELEIDPETMTEEEIDAAVDEQDFSFEPQGCWGEAFLEDGNTRFFVDFQDELEEMYEAVEADPRIVEAGQEISDCVADKGYDFSTDQDGFSDLEERFRERLDEIDAEISGSPLDDVSDEDFASMSEDEINAMFDAEPEMSDAGKAILAELQAEETAIAVAVWDCGGSGSPDSENMELFQEVLAEYEQRFIDDNAERLAEYRSE